MKKLAPTLLQTSGSVVPLILRIVLAAVMFPHGAQKALGWFGGPGFAPFMATFTDKMHIPAPLAFLVVLTEFLGPIALSRFSDQDRRICHRVRHVDGGYLGSRSFRVFHELGWKTKGRRP